MSEWQTNNFQNLTFSLEAEQVVLGSIILKPESLDEIAWLEPRDFFSEKHQTLFEYMRYLYDNDLPVDLVHMGQEMQKYGKLESMGGVSYFMELSKSAATAGHIGHYAEIVRKKAVRRRGIEYGRKVMELSENAELEDAEYFSEIDKGADELRPKSVGQLLHVRQTRKQYFDEKSNTDEIFIKTGFKNFDDWGGGYARKALIIKAGRPGVGKTAEALQEAMFMAKSENGAGAIFSQEMGRSQVIDRMIACASCVNYTRIRRKWFMKDKDEIEKVERTYDNIAKQPLYIKDSSGLTIQEIRADVRRLKREQGKIAFIMVDYLTLLKIPVPKGSSYAKEVGNTVWAAKQMAVEFDCPFIMLAQMSRAGETAEEPKLSHLKESGDIEQHADMVEFLWVDAKDVRTNASEIIVTRTIAKGRDTGMKTFKQLFKGYAQRYVDFDPPKRDGANEKNRK
jgi:replicative DNA helicase